MKLKLASILCAAAALFSLASCTEEPLGVSKLPTLSGEVVLTDVLATRGARVSPNYMLTSEFATADASKDGSGVVFEVKFASAATSLAAGKYTEASPAYAAPGNFVTGATGTKLYLDGKMHLVTAGTIDVALEGETYTFSAIVKLDNGQNYSLKFTGAPMTWSGFPELKVLNTVVSAQSNVSNGTKSITLNLSDGKFTTEFDMTTYQTVYKGKGNYLAIDIYSEDGYLAAGTYKPCATGGVINKGEYGIGWDPGDIYNIGMAFENWGTCWWTVDEAATPQTSAEKITTGDITVSLAGDIYTITVDNGELYAQFTGAIPAVTKPAAPADPWAIEGSVVFQHTEGMSFTMTDDTANNTLSDNTTPLSGVTLYWVQIKDADGKLVAELDLVTKEGAKSLAGEYKVTSYPDEVGEAGNGFYIDFSQWGGEGIMSGGSLLYGPDGTLYVVDADKSQIKVTEDRGQTTIIVKGTSNGATIAAKYVIGEIQEEGGDGEGGACGCDCDACKDCTGGGEGGDEDAFNGVQLAQFIHMQPGTGIVTVYVGDAGMTYDAQSSSVQGEGNYLKFDAYSADGKTLSAGTYYPCAVAGTVTEGTFGIGWDPGDLWGIGWVFTNWGTCYMTKAADGSETGVKIEDGTLKVETDGSNYTITIESSAMNLRYQGPLQ